jgi:hypothetical protein
MYCNKLKYMCSSAVVDEKIFVLLPFPESSVRTADCKIPLCT